MCLEQKGEIVAEDNRKPFLQGQYKLAVKKAIDSKEPHAIVLVENPGVIGGTELTVQSFSLKEYIAESDPEDALLRAYEHAACLGRRTWFIDCVGGEFSEEKGAFKDAWEKREWSYEIHGQSVPV